jgi:hypothetical protein
MLLLRLLCFSAVHFGLWYASVVVAYGSDLDHVFTRSALASNAASLCAVLQYPHDLLLRILPAHLLQQVPQLALGPIALNSVLWGIALSLLWYLLSASGRFTVDSNAPRSRFS